MALSLKADPLILGLTGQRVEATSGDLASRLAEMGWSLDRVREFRAERIAEHLPWPVPVAAEELGMSFAVYAAQLSEARSAIELSGPVTNPQRRGPLSPGEQRMISERPPHWG